MTKKAKHLLKIWINCSAFKTSAFTLLLCCCCCCYTMAWGQTNSDSLVLLNKDFQFRDGIYHNIEQLRANQPQIALENLGGSLVWQENAYLLKIETLYPMGRPDLEFKLDDFEIVTYKGLPFFRVFTDSIRGFTAYAALRVRGRLSYYSYERSYMDSVMIKAYNPATGQPFRQQKMARPQLENIKKVINIATGQLLDFTLDNMFLLLEDDPSLIKTLEALSVEEALKKMERFLLIYDDRNPLYLPK